MTKKTWAQFMSFPLLAAAAGSFEINLDDVLRLRLVYEGVPILRALLTVVIRHCVGLPEVSLKVRRSEGRPVDKMVT